MARPRKKEYKTGDQLHFIITEDFVETANAFFDHCDEEMLNASSVMRRAYIAKRKKVKLKMSWVLI